jgi:hypothetical protein
MGRDSSLAGERAYHVGVRASAGVARIARYAAALCARELRGEMHARASI